MSDEGSNRGQGGERGSGELGGQQSKSGSGACFGNSTRRWRDSEIFRIETAAKRPVVFKTAQRQQNRVKRARELVAFSMLWKPSGNRKNKGRLDDVLVVTGDVDRRWCGGQGDASNVNRGGFEGLGGEVSGGKIGWW